jgi:hypothetical protein
MVYLVYDADVQRCHEIVFDSRDAAEEYIKRIGDAKLHVVPANLLTLQKVKEMFILF